MLALKSTRLSQGGAREIDWGNPITRGLFDWNTPDVRGDMLPINGAAIIPSASGVSFKGNGTNSYWLNTRKIAPITTEGTLFSIVNGSTPNVDARIYAFGSSASITPTLSLQTDQLNRVNGGAFVRSLPSVDLTTGRPAFVDNESHALLLTFDPSGHNLWQDGEFAAFSAPVNSFAARVLDRIAIGSLFRSSASSFNAAPTSLCCAWNRSLSDPEKVSMFANPWQIFR
jgi:hypothetical protein